MIKSITILAPAQRDTVPRTRTHGFTLMEVLVVIVIIVLLFGLLLAIGSSTGSDTAQTRLRFQMLLTIADEYLVQTKGNIVNHEGNYPIDWSTAQSFTNYDRGVSIGIPDDSSERFVAAVMQITESREAILDLERTKVLIDKDDDGFFELRDAWGNMIAYVAGNEHEKYPKYSQFPAPLEPRNMKSALKRKRTFPEYPNRFFTSAGEDGKFGTADDLHSFAIE